MGRTVEFRYCAVGHLGHVQDVLSNFGTMGWEGQWNSGTLQWDTKDMSGNLWTVGQEGEWDSDTVQWDTCDSYMCGMFLTFLGLGDGGWERHWDWALCSGTLRTCQG